MVLLRHFWAILGLFWAATLFGADDPAKDRIRINEPDWPPFFYVGRPLGQKAGIAKDIVDLCFKQMGRTYEYVPLPIERMQNEMQLGQLDINFFSYKKERESFLTFGKELTFVTGYRPVVKKNSPIVIKSIKDFDAYKLGHTIGLRYSNEFLEYVQQRKKKG